MVYESEEIFAVGFSGKAWGIFDDEAKAEAFYEYLKNNSNRIDDLFIARTKPAKTFKIT